MKEKIKFLENERAINQFKFPYHILKNYLMPVEIARHQNSPQNSETNKTISIICLVLYAVTSLKETDEDQRISNNILLMVKKKH